MHAVKPVMVDAFPFNLLTLVTQLLFHNMNDLIIPQHEIKGEFNNSTENFHVITCLVGAGLNLIWFISDLFVLPEYAYTFLAVRLSVSSIALVSVFTRKYSKIDIYACMFILVLGISIQNAYMWSVMDLTHLQQHAIAYLVLFIGTGMLVLWELKFSIVLVLATVVSNIVFYKVNSKLSISEFIINGGLLVFTVALFSLFLIRTRYRLTYNEIRSRLQLAKSKEIIERENATITIQSKEISLQKDVLTIKNKEITDSITYAKRIQSAIIPSEEEFLNSFSDGFVFFNPKDIVSGDFYWKFEDKSKTHFAIADCTGHGVPGGFMSMLASTYLEDAVRSNTGANPAELLEIIRNKITIALRQGQDQDQSKDGMDLILCCFDKETSILEYASANNTSILLREGASEIEKLACDKQPCGFYPHPITFTNHSLKILSGDILYLFTDGFPDQFGGEHGKKFRYKQLHEVLLTSRGMTFAKQRESLKIHFETWKDKEEQTDDVLIVGIKLI
jgi:sigma-B regulation protein RsbU (phosphoserine phosphatase)